MKDLPLDFRVIHVVDLADRSAIHAAIAEMQGVAPKPEPPVSALRRILPTILVTFIAIVGIAIAAGWKEEGSNLMWWKPCKEKWLSQENYDACFQQAKSEFMPTVVEGRRSWFGIGPDVYKAAWVPSSQGICWDSRSAIPSDRFSRWKSSFNSAGYELVSEKSFISAKDGELFQGVWTHLSNVEDCPRVELD